LEMSYRKIKVRKDPNCAVCGENPTVTGLIDYDDFCGAVSDEAQQAVMGSTITVTELDDWLKSGKPIELVDVREPAEYEIVKIPGSVLIPKGDILNGQALAGACDGLLAADLEADLAAEHLEALFLAGVDVGRGDEAVGLHVGLDHDRLAAGLARGLAEDDPLAGDRVLDDVSCTNHGCSPLFGWSRAGSRRVLKIRLKGS